MIEDKLLKIAIQAARRAGAHQIRHYGRLERSEISQKSKNDFVTVVDKVSEKIIIDLIQKHFPFHAIQAEESGVSAGSGEYTWIIDPLDGTSNYIHQFPMFSVSIGIRHGQNLCAAVIFDPLHEELFTAKRGRGAFLNGKKIHVSRVVKLSDALMATGIPFRARNRFKEYFQSLKTISLASAGMRRGGSAALDLAYVACGRFEGFWEINLSPWDIAAGALLIQEAGGQISDVWGQGAYLKSGDVLASNRKIHRELCRITKPIFTRKKASKGLLRTR